VSAARMAAPNATFKNELRFDFFKI
jgi:hypothetical protein